MVQLGPWLPDSPSSPIALAVSGGGDSLCLAWLASRWRRHLLALVVDHGLRPESAAEAELTAQRLNAFGVRARILTLTNLVKGAGIADRARQARYAVLAEACRDAGCVDLLLGHQADDQAETVAIRQRAQSGADGLAGMAWITARPQIRLVRPLLAFSRSALRNTLRAAQLNWVDDPSNNDVTAERVRVRKTLAAEDSRAALWRLAIQSGQSRMQRETVRSQHLAQTVALLPHGWACLGNSLPDPDCLGALIRCVGGMTYPPSHAAVERLVSAQKESTLAGVQVLRHQNQWFLLREVAAMHPAMAAHNQSLWDNRFGLTLPAGYDGAGLTVAATGTGVPRALRQGWPARFCATLPALWRNGQRIAVPHLGMWEDPSLTQALFTFQPPVPVSGGAMYDLTYQNGPSKWVKNDDRG